MITDKLIYYWLSLTLTAARVSKLIKSQTLQDLWNNGIAESNSTSAMQNKKLFVSRDEKNLRESLDIYEQNGIFIATRPDYGALSEIDDPPTVLYCKGNIDLLKSDCVGIVGTRKASPYGLKAVDLFARGLSKSGLTIVSGLATGIDGGAHSAALATDGNTIAVLGSGFLHVSPSYHYNMYQQICQKGLVISEYPPDFEATKYTFLNRNRIISGVSKSVLVVEANERSGAISTANHAVRQNRRVFALPGDIYSPSSKGTNALIKNGAHLVTEPNDIAKFYNLCYSPVKKQTKTLDNFTEMVYNCLADGMKSYDQIVEDLHLINPSQLRGILLDLTLDGFIECVNDKYVVKVKE